MRWQQHGRELTGKKLKPLATNWNSSFLGDREADFWQILSWGELAANGKNPCLCFLAISTSEAARGELALSRFLAGIFQRQFDDCPVDLLACSRVYRAEFHHECRGRLQHHPAADFDRPIWLLFRELS
jgi:hypothetical protein